MNWKSAMGFAVYCLLVLGAVAAEPDFTLDLKLDLSSVKGEELLYDGGSYRVLVREAGKNAELEEYDRHYGNYLRFPLADGTCPIVEAVVPDAAAPYNEEYARPWRDSHRGCRVGVPLGALPQRQGLHDIRLTWRKTSLTLSADGKATDVDYLVQPLPRASVRKAVSPRVKSCRTGPAQAEPEADSKPIDRPIQYWTGTGFNTWVGDVVVRTWRNRLHLFYLLDRRHHRSKGGAGGHFFAHISSDDLVHWSEHPTVTPIEKYWFTCGTGTPFEYEGKLCLAYGVHSTRFVPREQTTEPQMLEELKRTGVMPSYRFEETGRIPLGSTWASTSDGIHFEHSGIVFHTTQNPAIECLADGSMRLTTGFWGDTGVGGVWKSRTMDGWTKTDMVSPLKGDCPCPFTWNGWHYLLQGFTGFASARNGEELVPRPQTDFYDGVSVPMVASWSGNRRILAGWCRYSYKRGWGGWLVFRELVQRDDGSLGTRFVPEIPMPSPVRKVACAGGKDLRLDFHPVSGGGCPVAFVVNPATGSAFLTDILEDGSLAKPKTNNLSLTGSLRVTNVRGLGSRYEVRHVVHYDKKGDSTVFDFEIAGNRTLIACRLGKYELRK